MKQQDILKLLNEASTADSRRAIAIQVELGEATGAMRPNGIYEISSPAAGGLTLLDRLFTKLYQESPEKLPEMLPVFEILCGDRSEDRWLA